MTPSEVSEKLIAAPGLSTRLAEIRRMVEPCIQCGTCSASCPNEGFMDMTPRRMWRALIADRVDLVWNSRTFSLCADCYLCTLRCPRGLPLTHAMAGLKRVAAVLALPSVKRPRLFYQAFLDNIRQYGRVREMEMMGGYFMALKDPLAPLSYTAMGVKLFKKGKLHPRLPSRNNAKLADLFDRVRSQEA